MSSRLVHLLLIALLLFGQVGGWLHELSHFAGSPGNAGDPGSQVRSIPGQATAVDGSATNRGNQPAGPDDPTDQQCLLCLTFAALALALPGVALALALLALRFALPAGAVLLTPALRRFAHQARGPPVLC